MFSNYLQTNKSRLRHAKSFHNATRNTRMFQIETKQKVNTPFSAFCNTPLKQIPCQNSNTRKEEPPAHSLLLFGTEFAILRAKTINNGPAILAETRKKEE